MALTKADMKAIQELMAATIAAATAVPAAEPATATKATRTRATKAATKAAEPVQDGDIGDPALVPVRGPGTTDGDYARVYADRYQGAVRVAVARAFTTDEGEVGWYRRPRQTVYLTTRADVDAMIAALTAARKHLAE